MCYWVMSRIGQHDRPPKGDCGPCKALAVLITCCLLCPSTAKAQLKEVRRVLVFYELGLASPAVTLIDQEVRVALDKSPYQIELYREYLETTLFPDEASQQKFRQWYIEKYRNRRPDLILAVGPSPIRFMADSHETYFRGIPIVFCGASEYSANNPKLNPDFTGVWENWEPSKTLELALKMRPGTEHVVVVGGMSSFDRHLEAIVQEDLRRYEGRLDLTYVTNLAMPALLERLKHLPDHTLVLYTSLEQDAAGTRFIDATQSALMVISGANAPVLSLADVNLGHGEVGGYLDSFDKEGQIVGGIARRILAGERPQDIPVVRGTDVYMFDWRALRRWGLKESDLPPGSIVLYRQPTAWESYKWYIMGGAFLCLIETLLIVGLFWQRARRRKVQQSLRERLRFETLCSELSREFINLPEEQISSVVERSLGRIAEFLKAERVTLYELTQEGSAFTKVFSWRREGFSLAPETVDSSRFPWFTSHLLNSILLLVPDSSNLPDEASADRESLVQSGFMSVAAVPLAAGGEVIGFMSFVSANQRTHWANDQVEQLRALADLFTNALRRIRIQTALRESEERFRLMASTAPVLIWMSGTDKLCTYFNKLWLDFTGKTFESEVGNGWTEGVHPEDLPRRLEAYTRAFDRREEFRIEYRLRRRDGEYRWMLDSGTPRFNPNGSFAGYIGSAIDVTDHKKAEEALSSVSRRLIEAQEEERRYIARELHDDVNQRVALLAIEVQRLEDALPESSVALRGQTAELSQRTLEISREVQLLSHRLHSSKLELLGVVAAIKSFCHELSAQQEVKISFAHSGVPRSLPRDTSLCLFRVLQEALRNAVKHSRVRHFGVDLRGVEGAIQLTVRDSGVGFDVEAARNNCGLGLVSMRERVSLVKGTISITSKPAAGTEINVCIPVTAAAVADQRSVTA
jgi:PAS domain S-box-containing protein